MSERRRIAGSLATLTVALGLALALRPLPVERIVSVYVLAVAAVCLAALTRVAGSRPRQASELEHALRRQPASRVRPPELVRIEREITLGTSNAGHLHRRLLPLLREAATARLAARHGVELERRPETARGLLGEDAWELLRPDRPEPDDVAAPGISLARLRAVVDALERT